MSKEIQNETTNLFLDNIVGNITADDLRSFVDNVWIDKENPIHKITNLSDIETVELGKIDKDDTILCTQGTDEGVYIALVKNPTREDLQKVNSQTSELPEGDDGQILTLENQLPQWIDKDFYFQVIDTMPIDDILALRPKPGSTYVALESSATASIPGEKGDGYTWDGFHWANFGQLRGPEGEVVYATIYDTFSDIDNKAVTPQGLNLFVNRSYRAYYAGAVPTPAQLIALLNSKLTNWKGKPFRFILQDSVSIDAIPLKTYAIDYIPEGTGDAGSANTVDKFYLQLITSL